MSLTTIGLLVANITNGPTDGPPFERGDRLCSLPRSDVNKLERPLHKFYKPFGVAEDFNDTCRRRGTHFGLRRTTNFCRGLFIIDPSTAEARKLRIKASPPTRAHTADLSEGIGGGNGGDGFLAPLGDITHKEL